MRVLVSGASKHGSTDEIARRIGSVLVERGHDVDVFPPTEVGEVGRYDVVVLGSAIYAGHWQKEARQLADRQAGELVHRPVWLFSSGPVGDPLQPDEVPVDAERVRKTIHAFDHHIFAGKLEKKKLSMPERAVVKALRVPEGDYRDWEDVDLWAMSIADSISSG